MTVTGHREGIEWNKIPALQNRTFKITSNYESSYLFYTILLFDSIMHRFKPPCIAIMAGCRYTKCVWGLLTAWVGCAQAQGDPSTWTHTGHGGGP